QAGRYSPSSVSWEVAAQGLGSKTFTARLRMKNAEKTSTYWVWGRDKVVHRVVDMPDLVQWIKGAKVTGDHWICSEPDDRWRKAADFPEFQAMCGSQRQGSRV